MKLGDILAEQLGTQIQRSIIKNDIQQLFPEFYHQHQDLFEQAVDDLTTLNIIKATIDNSIGSKSQQLECYLEDIRQHGYQSINYRKFFDLARLLIDQLEDLAHTKQEIFNLLNTQDKTIQQRNTVSHTSQAGASLSISRNQRQPAKRKKKKEKNNRITVNPQLSIDLITQIGFVIPTDRQQFIFGQIQALPNVSQRRLYDHLILITQCTSKADTYKYMTKLHNGRISIKFDYENFYRIGIEKDGTCIGILAKGHEYDQFIKPC